MRNIRYKKNSCNFTTTSNKFEQRVIPGMVALTSLSYFIQVQQAQDLGWKTFSCSEAIRGLKMISA